MSHWWGIWWGTHCSPKSFLFLVSFCIILSSHFFGPYYELFQRLFCYYACDRMYVGLSFSNHTQSRTHWINVGRRLLSMHSKTDSNHGLSFRSQVRCLNHHTTQVVVLKEHDRVLWVCVASVMFVCLFVFNEDLVWVFHPLRWYYDLQVCIGGTHTSVPRECRS